MKALLLAAGRGTRLQPYTDILPKCLMPVRGIPLLQYWIENLLDASVAPLLVNLHHHHTLVEKFIDRGPWRDRVQTVYEDDLLLTAGTLLRNREFFGNAPLMLVHADNLSFCDFGAYIRAHGNRPEGCAITMMTFESTDPQSCGIVELDSRGVVAAFHEKVANPPGNRANAAVYILEPELFGFLESLGKEKIDFSTEVLPHYMGRIFAWHNDVYHRDIGNIESLLAAQLFNCDLSRPREDASELSRGELEAEIERIAGSLR